MTYIAIAKKQWQPINGVAHCQTEGWFLWKNPHKVDGNITENDAGFSLARIFLAKTPGALLLLNEWLRRSLSYIYIWIGVCFSIIQADKQHLKHGVDAQTESLFWNQPEVVVYFRAFIMLGEVVRCYFSVRTLWQPSFSSTSVHCLSCLHLSH